MMWRRELKRLVLERTASGDEWMKTLGTAIDKMGEAEAQVWCRMLWETFGIEGRKLVRSLRKDYVSTF